MPVPMPAAEVNVDADLIRSLVSEQHPDLADRAVASLAHGWDNALFRLGDDLVVRAPRRAAAAELQRNEQRWLPYLAPRLPLPIPAPIRTGRPSGQYPWDWSIVAYFPGQVAALTAPVDPTPQLAAFLAALHTPASADAPRSPVRGVPLAVRAQAVETNLAAASSVLAPDVVEALGEIWRNALHAPAWSEALTWCHGDLHPANVLVDQGAISAIIDFGDLTAGDPATDLSVAWSLIHAADRSRFWTDYADAGGRVDDALVTRARGWATLLGLALITHSADNDLLDQIGHSMLKAVLED